MKVKIEFGKNKPNIFHIAGLTGFIEITQQSSNQPTTFLVAIGGLTPNKLHGFHIHEKPVENLGDLNKSCDSCGGHFNPTGKQHGSRLNKDKGKNSHVGDLINNLKADKEGICVIQFSDDRACLLPSKDKNYSILGKSIVIHQDTDDLGRQGLTDSTPYIAYDYKCNCNLVFGDNTPLSKKEKYSDKKKRESSKINGNAGKRIACANII